MRRVRRAVRRAPGRQKRTAPPRSSSTLCRQPRTHEPGRQAILARTTRKRSTPGRPRRRRTWNPAWRGRRSATVPVPPESEPTPPPPREPSGSRRHRAPAYYRTTREPVPASFFRLAESVLERRSRLLSFEDTRSLCSVFDGAHRNFQIVPIKIIYFSLVNKKLYTAFNRIAMRSEEHTSELQSLRHLVC